jgi:membrane-bound lytic murein transglycosylase D
LSWLLPSLWIWLAWLALAGQDPEQDQTGGKKIGRWKSALLMCPDVMNSRSTFSERPKPWSGTRAGSRAARLVPWLLSLSVGSSAHAASERSKSPHDSAPAAAKAAPSRPTPTPPAKAAPASEGAGASATAAPEPPSVRETTPDASAKDDRIQRRAIRGGPVDLSRESAELRELRAFEVESFPRAGLRESMGLGDGPGGGHAGSEGYPGGPSGGLGPDAVPEGLHSPLGPRPDGTAPSANIPWLSALRLLDNLGLSPTFVRFEAHVIKYLEFYKEEKRGRSIMASWLRKQGRYKPLIEQALDKYGMPRFLLYISMIESGYDPHDRSNKGAVGLWQFLPEGARIYGLRVDYWVDERKDPVRSTEAAARYLGDLKARFGSWHLALAAFNAGYGAVLRAMQKYNTNDYWELCRHEDGLPWETLLYVPKAIATALVGENRSFFGYDDLQPDPPISYDSVPVRGSVSLATAARVVGSTTEELQRLNPHLRRGRTPPPGGAGETWELRLPPGSASVFGQSADARGERLEPYPVRFGERLEDIAKLRGTSVAALRRINSVEDTAEIRPGVTLLVPPHAAAAKVDGPPPPLSADEIVVVAVPDHRLVVPGKKRVFYRVISGDSIWAIARFFKVNQADLLRWNNLDPEATLATKMVLDLWVDKDFDTSQVVLVDPSRVRVVTTGSDEFFELVETLRGRKRVQHKCQAGDTLEKIARHFGLAIADVERINRMGRTSELRPGQTIIIYQSMSSEERAAALQRLLPGAVAGPGKDKPGEPDRDRPGKAATGDDSADSEASDEARSEPRGEGKPAAAGKDDATSKPAAAGKDDAAPADPPKDPPEAAAVPLPPPPPTLPPPPLAD